MERVTNGILVSDLIRSLNERMRTLSDLQNQLNTGKRVFYASDDPAAAGLILELRNRLRQNEQFQENAESGVGWLSESEATLQQLNDLLTQARTDALEGSNGALSPEDMMALAENVNGYLDSFLALANSEYGGKSLFAGTSTTSPAFQATRDSGTGWITSVIPNPEGITGQIMRQIGNENIQVNVSGLDTFQPGGPGADQDVFQVLINLRDALEAGDATAVGDCLEGIDQASANVSDSSALAGSLMNRLTSLQDMLILKETNLTSHLSEQEDADLVETMTQLTLEQNAYQVALNVGSMIIQPSLANFI